MSLFFRKTGSGPPLIILHGLYGSSDNWTVIGKKLGERFTVFMIDLRNHGRSSHFNTHTFNNLRDDLKIFMDRHHIGRATLIGHSMGGKAAMWFAADYPELVQKLIIADIAPVDYLLRKEQSQYYLHHNILLSMHEINFSTVDSREEVSEILAEKIDDAGIRSFLMKNLVRDRETHQLKWRINVKVLYDYLDEIVGGVNQHWFSDRIPIIVYPVVFIRGLLSNYLMPEDEQPVKKIYPEAKIIDIPGAGHMLHVEKPEEFIKAALLH